jgi:hypothetical protein
MQMKQTAVEWLENELQEYFFHGNGTLEAIWKQAKEMEKEQIMDAYEEGSHTIWNEDTWILVEKQEYYNETYNK